jgi:hypothetical protein
MKEYATLVVGNVTDAWVWPTFARQESGMGWSTGEGAGTLQKLLNEKWRVIASAVSIECCKAPSYHFVLEREVPK